jgi:glycosyltransferase involved in cell wall biosynthesis
MHKNNPHGITIIIPCYNDNAGLDILLRSIKIHVVKSHPCEVIVIDDASEIVINNATIRNETNLGPAKSRLRGAKLAKNNFLLFIDSDDYFEESISNVLDRYSHADLTLFGVREVANGREIRKWRPGLNKMLIRNLHSWNFVINKKIFLAATVETECRAFEDWHVILRASSMFPNMIVNILNDVIGKSYCISRYSLSNKALSDKSFSLPDILKDDLLSVEVRNYVARLLIRNAVSRGVSSATAWQTLSVIKTTLVYGWVEFVTDVVHGKIPKWIKLFLKRL